MLMTSNGFRGEDAYFAYHIGLERSFTVVCAERRGLVFDSAFSPASRVPSRNRTALYVLLRGHLRTSTGLHAKGPALVRMREDVLEGANGGRETTVRTRGEPHVLIGFLVGPEWVIGNAHAPPERFDLDARLEACAEHAVRSFGEGRPAIESTNACYRVVRQLAELGFVDLAITRTFAPERYGDRVWNGLATFFSKLDTAPSLTHLTDLVEVSPRHADRLLARFTEAYGLPNEGFRDLTRRWRLKLATLLLSSPSLGIARVARVVGYGGPEALANALAAGGLPPASNYRRLWSLDPNDGADGAAS